MEMILVDWTRMGKVYCLAGAVAGRCPASRPRVGGGMSAAAGILFGSYPA